MPSWAAQHRPSRIYFGVEFCQHLLPSEADVIAAAEQCRSRGLGMTLLTPYVTDGWLDPVSRLVKTLIEVKAPDPEVVLNDWGLLRRLRREFEGQVEWVLGRGLHRMMRDPRLADVGPEHLGGDTQPDLWLEGSYSSREFRLLLAELDLHRVEIDYPLQGLRDLEDFPLNFSLHLPYGMIASGRNCMVSSYGKPPSLRFMVPIACDAPCRDFTIHLRAPWSRRGLGNNALPLLDANPAPSPSFPPSRRVESLPPSGADPSPRFLQKGNTHFYELNEDQILAALQWAASQRGLDRVVVEPALPM